MFNIQYIDVPFIASYPIYSYNEKIGLSLSPTGVYFQPLWANDNFLNYPSGNIAYFSGFGFWSQSGYAINRNAYFYDDFEGYSASTGFTTGFLDSGFMQIGNASFYAVSYNGSFNSYKNFFYDDFENYPTGFTTGLMNSGSVQNNYTVQSGDIAYGGSFNSYKNFFYDDFENYATGFTTGLLNSGSTQNNYVVNSGGVSYGGFFHSSMNRFNDSGTYATGAPLQWISNTPATAGNFDSGLYFSPAIAYIPYSYQLSQQISTGDFTVEFWIKRGTWPSSSLVYLLQMGTGNIGFSILNVNIYNTLQLSLGGYVFSPQTGAISPNLWTHVAMVRQQGVQNSVSLYLSGLLVVTGYMPPNQVLPVNDLLCIGSAVDTLTNQGAASYPHTGYLSDIRYWNYARSSAQINSNYNVEIPPQTGLAIYGRFTA